MTSPLDIPSVGWRLPECWAAVAALEPGALGVAAGGPFLVELAGSEQLGAIDAPTMQGTARDVGRKSWEATRVLVVRSRRGDAGGRIAVGRGVGSDVIIPHAMVSKEHAFFIERDGRFGLADAGSRNGTAINGEALTPGTVFAVADGAEILFGETVFLFVAPESLHTTLRTMFPAETK